MYVHTNACVYTHIYIYTNKFILYYETKWVSWTILSLGHWMVSKGLQTYNLSGVLLYPLSRCLGQYSLSLYITTPEANLFITSYFTENSFNTIPEIIDQQVNDASFSIFQLVRKLCSFAHFSSNNFCLASCCLVSFQFR